LTRKTEEPRLNNDTPQRPVTKTIGPVSFTDPYDWLQQDTPQALAWMWARDAEAQDAARACPQFEPIKAAIRAGGSALDATIAAPPRLLGGRWFHLRPSPRSPVRALWISDRADDPGRVLVDSADLRPPGANPDAAVIHWVEPSPGGERVALAVTSAGEMAGRWRVVETADGRVLPIDLPATAYTGGLPGWLPDASGFYLADRVADGRHRIVFHPVMPGSAARPERVFELNEIPANVSGVTIEVSPDGTKAIALAGPHERIALMLGDLATGRWRPFLPQGHHGECQGIWLDDATYLARVHDEQAPRGRVVEIPVARSRDSESWREIVPTSKAVIRAVGFVEQHVVLTEVLDCAVRFRALQRDGTGEHVLPLPGPGNSMIAMVYRRFDRSDALCVDFGSFVQRSTNFRYQPLTRTLTPLSEVKRLDGITVTQRFATSIDGTAVPYFVVHREDLDLGRPQPALITGYGGFNVALLPSPLAHVASFVEAGGIYIHANLRGGGEYGKQWHEAGRLACKWNVFADLFAVAEQCIADGLTTPSQFAMTGASNGGLLAGAAIVHRPDLWRVVVPVVPIFDMLEPLPLEPRFDAIRAIFLEDYGAPEHPVLGKVLHSYSPYHNVRPGIAYPAVFQVFGEKDIGCMPFHGRKFTAALRAATSSGHPVHLRVWKDTGHGASDPESAVAQPAEWLAFVMQQLGMRCPERAR
jgi:prolyl oligopeptidase